MFVSRFEVHGAAVLVESFDSRIKTDLDHDFAYFLTSKAPEASVPIFWVRYLPTSQKSKFWVRLFKTKRASFYMSPAGERRLCFFEKAYVDYAFDKKQCTVYCDDPVVGYEAVYLVLLSYLGENFDSRNYHRIHGLGFTFRDHGVILLAPSGGGKSTLLLGLLERPEVQVLSDDTPVVTKDANMLAFPQRIAIEKEPNVPAEYVRKFSRVNHSTKFVVGSEYFKEKIKNQSAIEWLVVADTKKQKQAKVEEVSRLSLLWPMMKWLVVGYETPQIWELYLRPTKAELKKKSKILLSRLWTAQKLLRQSRVAKFSLSEDPKVSEDALTSFLANR